ncbi:MAG: Zn-dependent hydrolase [Alphaproteobacteria bacterium]
MELVCNIDRLNNRLTELGTKGALPIKGVSRLAFSNDDKLGRDLVVSYMKELNLNITIDQIGNVIGTRKGKKDLPPVLMGSHIDTVATGGLYDGCLGVLAGIEVINVLNEHNITTKRPVAVGFFSNEEGCAVQPDMMGSMVHQGHLSLEENLSKKDTNGETIAERLEKICYAGSTPVNTLKPFAFLEIHIEQGPILDKNQIQIGAVTGVQGISWQELTIKGISNHAGTTPMNYRNDAGLAAAKILCYANSLAVNGQLATIGVMRFKPNLINVIPEEVVMTVDLRNPNEEKLQQAENELKNFVKNLAKEHNLTITSKQVARFLPVAFNDELITKIEQKAKDSNLSVQRIVAGAGHDAQSFAPNCPTAMIFIPNKDGISHNIEEYASPKDIENGVNVLLSLVSDLAM